MSGSSGNLVETTPGELQDILAVCYAAKRPVYIEGEPGIGKSAGVWEFTRARGIGMIDFRASQHDPVDICGLPHIGEGGLTGWSIPDILPQVTRDGAAGIFFADELPLGAQMMQSAMYSLVHDRRAGSYCLPDGWVVWAAGNPSGRGVVPMSQALGNRFLHIHVRADFDSWCKWATDPARGAVHPMVIAGLRALPHLFNPGPDDARELAFPTPRSWTYVSDVMGELDRMAGGGGVAGAGGAGGAVELALIAGSVGQGAAVEFAAFVELYRSLAMHSIDEILLSPDTAPVPDYASHGGRAVAALYAISAALAARSTAENFGRVIRYLDRIPREYSVYAVRDATIRDPGLCATREFTAWAIAHDDILS